MVNKYLRKTPGDLFFFFPLQEPSRSKLLVDFQRDAHVREQALGEVIDLQLLLGDRTSDPCYPKAFRRWAYRMRELEHPQALGTHEGVQAYYDHLVRVLQPTHTELRATYADRIRNRRNS